MVDFYRKFVGTYTSPMRIGADGIHRAGWEKFTKIDIKQKWSGYISPYKNPITCDVNMEPKYYAKAQ